MTKTVQYLETDIYEKHPRRILRNIAKDMFIENYGSGTLRKSHKLGFDIQEAYLKERARFEFGSGFDIIQRSRVTYSDIKLVSASGLTELGWHAERMIELRPFESDLFRCKQFEVEHSNGTIIKGAGILVVETSASWIPQGYIVYSIVTEKKDGKYLPAVNPF